MPYIWHSRFSYYNPLQEIKNATLQVITPFDEEAVEVRYNKNSITILNSNNLKITNVLDTDNLTELPDGLYTAKMSVCPEDQNSILKNLGLELVN